MVTGGRDYDDEVRAFDVLDRLHEAKHFEIVMHGACGWCIEKPWTHDVRRLRGADRLADRWATSRGVTVERVPANWTRLFRRAGPVRNGHMLDRMPALVLAFPGDRGTADAVRQARGLGIAVVAVQPAGDL
jgi:hypothetical protein